MNKKHLCKSIVLLWLTNLSTIAFGGSEPPASHLSASELLELYSSMYSSIHNMSVSYTDVVEEVILMRLADREGKLDLVSTPNGKYWFYRRAREVNGQKRSGYFQSGDSRDNPYISRKYLDERVRHFSDGRLKQIIMGQFVDSGGEILKGEYIDRALSLYAETLATSPTTADTYITGWDLARKRTATVGITIQLVDANQD